MERERGSASVEFSLVLPVLVVILLGVAQMGVTVGEVLVLHHAAREGARTYAVTADPVAAVQAARRAGRLSDDATVEVRTEEDAALVEIATTARVFPGVPAPNVVLRARASMRRERFPS
jgi:hypothetical protein